MSYPKALAFSVNSFPVTTNVFRIYPYSLQKADPGSIIQVSLPANTLVDLRTFTWHFKAYTNSKAVPLPTHAESLIDSVYLSANGVQLTNAFSQYGVLYNALADYQLEDRRSMRAVLQNGDFLPSTGTAAPYTAAFTDKGPGPLEADGQDMAVANWLGMTGGTHVTTPIIDTSVVGDLRINIRLAANAVLPAAGSYFLNNIFFTVKTYSIEDGGLYSSLIQKRLENGGIQLNLLDWYNFQGGNQNTSSFAMRFSLSTQSLNALYGTLLPANLGEQAFNTTKRQSKQFKFGFNASTDFGNSVYSVNSLNFPAYGQRFSLAEVWQQTIHAMGETANVLGSAHPELKSLKNFAEHFYIDAVRFNHIGSSDEALWKSGLDSRGNNTQISWSLQGSGPALNVTPVVFAETTRTITIGVGRQVMVVA